MMRDFAVTNHGSTILIAALSEPALAWCAEHLPTDAQTWGGTYVVEHRYIGDILAGIVADGLTVTRGA